MSDDQPISLPDIMVGAVRLPGDDAHDFVQHELNTGTPQLPQHDKQAEVDAYRSVARHLPLASTAKVFGAMPDFKGGVEPGVAQELYNGDYKGALSDLFGLAVSYGISRHGYPLLFPKGGNGPIKNAKKQNITDDPGDEIPH